MTKCVQQRPESEHSMRLSASETALLSSCKFVSEMITLYKVKNIIAGKQSLSLPCFSFICQH